MPELTRDEWLLAEMALRDRAQGLIRAANRRPNAGAVKAPVRSHMRMEALRCSELAQRLRKEVPDA
jgi:hypothetical protein